MPDFLWVFDAFGSFPWVSGRSWPVFLPPWPYFRVCVSVAVSLSTETSVYFVYRLCLRCALHHLSCRTRWDGSPGQGLQEAGPEINEKQNTVGYAMVLPAENSGFRVGF